MSPRNENVLVLKLDKSISEKLPIWGGSDILAYMSHHYGLLRKEEAKLPNNPTEARRQLVGDPR